MTNTQLATILDAVQDLPQGNDLSAAILQLAADSAYKKSVGSEHSDILTFTEKDISKMPKTYKRLFRYNKIVAHIHKRPSGKNNWNYEIRCQVNLKKINVSSNSLASAKEKFIQRLHEIENGAESVKSNIPTTLNDFAEYFFENFHKRKVTSGTLRIARNQFKNHIAPHFKNLQLKKITPTLCQGLIDRLDGEGKNKTADDINSILNMIFKTALKLGVILNNPMDMVFHKQHEREHGTALTKEEEKLLLDSTKSTPLHLMYAVALYTGMRPNEYVTARIDGDFIVANNSKRKNGKVELKKIPITPMLKPYLDGVTELKFCSQRVIHERFNKILPNHKLYDLRTTFYTRCQECNIAPAARDEFVGHSLGALGNAYTDLSDEFLLKEGEKFKY